MVHPVFADLPTTVFEEMSGLARELGAINLGQGFPDDAGPEPVRAKAAQALMTGSNQYPPMRGLLELRRAVASTIGCRRAWIWMRARSPSPPARPRPWRRRSCR
jgi:N-succinyldiaminopimelate aminotransferase